MRTRPGVSVVNAVFILLVTVLGVTVFPAIPSAAAVNVLAGAQAATDGGDLSTLFTGQTLGYGPGRTTDYLRSPRRLFSLDASDGRINMDEYLPAFELTFGPIWWMPFVTSGPADNGFLAVQADGNLVLYSSAGRALWASNTVGTGHHNRLQLQDDGNLVLRNDTNRVVWATYTTRVALGAGDTMTAGNRMVAYNLVNLSQWDVLTMQSDGNLVMTSGTKVLWATNTHVPGSYLVMQNDANLVLRAPTGRALWASYTMRFGAQTWADFEYGYLQIKKFLDPQGRFWKVP